MSKLWLKQTDITELTALSGNIDSDALIPFVTTAQKTEMKRVLGLILYNKIDADIQNETPLSGNYKIIFDEFIVPMLVYYSCTNYISFGGYKISNTGIHKVSGEGVASAESKEVDVLIGRFRQLAVSVETAFFAYIKTVNIPEYTTNNEDNANTFFPWF